MAELSDRRQERFAQALARGAPQSAAYRYAGYEGDSGNACRARKRPEVSARVAEIEKEPVQDLPPAVAPPLMSRVPIPRPLRTAAAEMADLLGQSAFDYIARAVARQVEEDQRTMTIARAAAGVGSAAAPQLPPSSGLKPSAGRKQEADHPSSEKPAAPASIRANGGRTEAADRNYKKTSPTEMHPNARRAMAQIADGHAARVAPIIAKLKAEGCTSLERLANALNARRVPSPRGARWYAASVRNLLARLDRDGGNGCEA